VKARATFNHLVGGIAFVLAGAGLAAAVILWLLPAALAIPKDAALWEKGQPATDINVHGTDRSRKFIFHTYELTVEYTAPDGVPRDARLEIDTLGSMDHEGDPDVRVDPDDPRHIVLNWAVQASGARWAHAGLLGLVLALMSGVTLYAGWATLHKLALIHRVARSGEELLAEVLGEELQMYKGKPNGVRFKLRLPPGPPWEAREVTANLGKDRGPLRAGDKHVVMLAVADAAASPILVEGDHYPFVAS
jgi:hypothetical protein